MPAIDIRIGARPDNGSEAFDAAPDNTPDRGAPAQDFASVMRSTLAPRTPQAAKPAPQGTATGEKNSARGKALSRPPDASSEGKDFPDKLSASADSGKSSGAPAAEEASPPDPITAAAGETTDPLPAFMSLPLFFSGGWSGPAGVLPTGTGSGPGKFSTSGMAGQTDGLAGQGASAPATLAAITAPLTEAKPGDQELTSAGEPSAKGNEGAAAGQNVHAQKEGATGEPVAGTKAAPPETLKIGMALTALTLVNSTGPLAGPNGTANATATGTAGLPPEADPRPATLAGFAATDSSGWAADNAGTGVALMDSSMKNPQNANKVAGPDVKVLPVGEGGAAVQQNLPTQLLVPTVRAAENQGGSYNLSLATGDAPAADTASVLKAADLPLLTDMRMRAMDRMHDMVSLHAMRLMESKSDTLSVMIKPTVGTELSLELRQRGEGVEAQATLVRGDHELLSQHWTELQQRLEQRGIKLGPLGGEGEETAADHGQFQHSEFAQEDEAQQASAFAEFAAAGPAGGATARLAALHDGWESWA